MQIKNEFVKIRMGDKKYNFHNFILNSYLKMFASAQLNGITGVWIDRTLRHCLLKFDEPLESLTEDTELHNQDFDICIMGDTRKQQIVAEQQINIQYDYEALGDVSVYDYSERTSVGIKLSDYYGKKITAIGFNSWWVNDTNTKIKYPVCAVLDTSNYNIYLQENQDLTITRKDIITSDALFYTPNKNIVPGPAHLAPIGIPKILDSIYDDTGFGKLYSIGLSSYPTYIDKEYIIGQDIEASQNENEILITGLENYLSTDSPLFSSEDLYASEDLYSTKTDYRYIIFKYKVWQDVHSRVNDEVVNTYTDTGYYYYQAIPIDKFGRTNLKIKYERG